MWKRPNMLNNPLWKAASSSFSTWTSQKLWLRPMPRRSRPRFPRWTSRPFRIRQRKWSSKSSTAKDNGKEVRRRMVTTMRKVRKALHTDPDMAITKNSTEDLRPSALNNRLPTLPYLLPTIVYCAVITFYLRRELSSWSLRRHCNKPAKGKVVLVGCFDFHTFGNSAFYIKSFVSWFEICNYFEKLLQICFAQGVHSLGFPGCWFLNENGHNSSHTLSSWLSGLSSFFPFTLKWRINWLKKPTLTPNFEQLVQNELVTYSHITHKLGSRHKTLYGKSAISKSMKIEAP